MCCGDLSTTAQLPKVHRSMILGCLRVKRWYGLMLESAVDEPTEVEGETEKQYVVFNWSSDIL